MPYMYARSPETKKTLVYCEIFRKRLWQLNCKSYAVITLDIDVELI